MKKLQPVTDSEWQEVNEFNKFILDDFITNSTELSKRSINAYKSNLKIWFIWVKDNLNNKKQTDIKSLDFKRYQNWLINRGCSSSDCANKRAAISSLNNYIEVYYQDDFPTFRNFINKSIARPPKTAVHEKEPLTKEEFKHLIDVLEERKDYQKVAYLKFTFETGCRRAESRQLLREVVDYEPTIKHKIDDGGVETEIRFYVTHKIRCKGRGNAGKIRKFKFSEDTRRAIQRWIDSRDDDCPYVFVSRYKGEVVQVGETTFNNWCRDCFSKIVGRRCNPHQFRASRATQLAVEEGIDIKVVQQLLGHESSTTTEIYVVRDESEETDELFMI